VVVAFASLVIRWRRSADVERQQLKWVALGYVATLVLFALARFMPLELAGVVAGLAMLPLPLAIGVAVLRHGLWEVDLVISRGLVYGLLSAVVVAVYATTVWLLGDLLGATTGAPILATTLIALLALPLRSLLQRHVNRWVHGDVEEPYAVLARLGDRLASAAAPEELTERVLPSVVEQVARSLRAGEAALALRDGTVTSYGGSGAGEPLTVPLVYAGQRLGDLTVRRPTGFDEGAVSALDRLAAQAAVAAHTVLLAREAQRAREAIVLAREEERRRLRRDLHDGVGPSLAALALHAETARHLAAEDPAAATRLLDRLVPRLNAAVADVRALVHELRPPMLDELGLASAVAALADRLSTDSTRVVLDEEPLPELPAAVEVAAYHIAGEAAGNAVRHAAATTVRVGLRAAGDQLELTVTDDGRGLPTGLRPGLGSTTMRERAEELGGHLQLRTGPSGTTVVATLPLAPPEAADRSPIVPLVAGVS
jgi:signal transduction histidine kinase